MTDVNMVSKAVLRVEKFIADLHDDADQSEVPGLMEESVEQSALTKKFAAGEQFRQRYLRGRDSSTPEGQKQILRDVGSKR